MEEKMETREFKRAMYLTLVPKQSKEGFRSVLKKRRDINLSAEIIALRGAVSHLTKDLTPYVVPGVPLNDILRSKARENLGEVLHHAITTAKLLKVKTPASQRKIKPKHTPTALLMEIERIVGEMFDTFAGGIQSAHVVPMNDEERATAKARYDESEQKRKAKFDAAPAVTKDADGKDVPKGDYKPGKEPDYTKIVAEPVNEEVLKGQVTHLLSNAYEFAWAMSMKSGVLPDVSPVAQAMEARINRIKGNYPAGFFTPPPPKPAPAGLKPGQKREKKTTEAKDVVTPAEAKA